MAKPKNKYLNLEPLTRTKYNMSDGIFGQKQYWLFSHLIFSPKIDRIMSPRQMEMVYIKINAGERKNFSSHE